MKKFETRKDLKIGATGTGGTGKTTLMLLLAKKLDLPMVPSVSREVQTKWGLKTEADQQKLDPKKLRALQDDILAAKIAKDKMFEGFCADRTALDSFAYGLQRSSEQYTQDDIEDQEKKVLASMKRLDMIIYFPMGLFDPPEDGFRAATYTMNRVHDSIIRGTLERWKLPFITVSKGKPTTRLTRVYDVLRPMLLPPDLRGPTDRKDFYKCVAAKDGKHEVAWAIATPGLQHDRKGVRKTMDVECKYCGEIGYIELKVQNQVVWV